MKVLCALVAFSLMLAIHPASAQTRATTKACPEGFVVVDLPERDRKAIARFLIEAEDRAEVDAERQGRTNREKNHLTIELTKRYSAEAQRQMAKRYRRPESDVSKIWVEGACRQWDHEVPRPAR